MQELEQSNLAHTLLFIKSTWVIQNDCCVYCWSLKFIYALITG